MNTKFVFVFVLPFLITCRLDPKPAPIDGLISLPTNVQHFSKPDTNIYISAHRGGMGYPGYPENCIETFEYITDQIPAIIECDVSISLDEQLYLMHDNSLLRTTNGIGGVYTKEWDYISELKLKDDQGKLTDFKVPKFSDALKWARGKAILSVDIKERVPYQRIVEEIKKYNAEPYCIVIVYQLSKAKKILELAPELMISMNIRNENELSRVRVSGIDMERIIAFTGTRRKNPGFFDMMRQEGIATIFGTLGNIDKQAEARGNKIYDEFLDAGVNILATDRPLELAEYIASKRIQQPNH